MKKKSCSMVLAVMMLTWMLAGCGNDSGDSAAGQTIAGAAATEVTAGSMIDTYDTVNAITVAGDGINGEYLCSPVILMEMKDNRFGHIYSYINNWPTKKFCAAEGVTLKAVLQNAGVWESFQTVTFRGDDGYECTLTRTQIEQSRYYYPGLQEDSAENAQPVEMIIAQSYNDNTVRLEDAKSCKNMLVFGQSNIRDYNSPAFVEHLTSIIVSSEPAGQWEKATVFPLEGYIAAGETVKLQHPAGGPAKMYYTTDGSEPTVESTIYNPSTYRPEMNVPIQVNESMTIKVLVSGYGKNDSEIAEYHFKVRQEEGEDADADI